MGSYILHDLIPLGAEVDMPLNTVRGVAAGLYHNVAFGGALFSPTVDSIAVSALPQGFLHSFWLLTFSHSLPLFLSRSLLLSSSLHSSPSCTSIILSHFIEYQIFLYTPSSDLIFTLDTLQDCATHLQTAQCVQFFVAQHPRGHLLQNRCPIHQYVSQVSVYFSDSCAESASQFSPRYDPHKSASRRTQRFSLHLGSKY